MNTLKHKNRLALLASSFLYINVDAVAVEVPLEQRIESEPNAYIQETFSNNIQPIGEEEDIKYLKDAFISPFHYLQDPIALDMGYNSHAGAGGSYSGGISSIVNFNVPTNGASSNYNTTLAQIWGQTGRLGGFALGGGATAVINNQQTGDPYVYGTTALISPTQAYINYQYKNKLDVTAGNILISTPWVSSFGSAPGGTYALGNNYYQGVEVNVQALKSLLVTGFTAWSYQQYPNYLATPQTFYNTMGGNLAGIGSDTTSGVSGIGLTWNPVDSYTGQLWLYNFASYASMAYVDNAYNLPLSELFSFDFGLQAYTQGSSSTDFTNRVSLPGETGPAGVISSNGIGGKIALNIGNNTTSISYNTIFGPNGSFLNGGMVTPYTYGMEIDPLYTTPALTSLAELGSGYAYTIRNSTYFLEKSLKFNLSMSQFFVNQVYAGQPDQVTEYDAALLYRIPHTNMNVWSRLVYVEQPENAGGSRLQPRFIFNWTY